MGGVAVLRVLLAQLGRHRVVVRGGAAVVQLLEAQRLVVQVQGCHRLQKPGCLCACLQAAESEAVAPGLGEKTASCRAACPSAAKRWQQDRGMLAMQAPCASVCLRRKAHSCQLVKSSWACQLHSDASGLPLHASKAEAALAGACLTQAPPGCQGIVHEANRQVVL